jgi:hypothetical protein
LGISEARWTSSGKRRLASEHTIIFSRRSDDQHSERVALLLKRKTEKALIEWKPLGPRLLKARFHSKYTKLTVLVSHAPTEDKDTKVKDAFYDQLQAAMKCIRAHDNFNAEVGSENNGREYVMGKHGTGTINKNGKKLVKFCEKNNLVTGGTLFQNKHIHKIT